MNDYIKREGAIKAITRKHDEVLSVVEAIEDIESVPSADVVTREQYEQIHWERDVALHQLEEIGKGLGEKMVDVIERSDDANTSNALNALDCVGERKKGEWDMFDLISSAYYGKGMYFKQDNGIVYSRHSGEYMTVDEAIREFVSLIDEDVICVPSVTTVWGDGEAPTYVLQKRGKWINPRSDSEMCSACGVRFSISSLFAVGGNEEPNFCPNCGADMREGN